MIRKDEFNKIKEHLFYHQYIYISTIDQMAIWRSCFRGCLRRKTISENKIRNDLGYEPMVVHSTLSCTCEMLLSSPLAFSTQICHPYILYLPNVSPFDFGAYFNTQNVNQMVPRVHGCSQLD